MSTGKVNKESFKRIAPLNGCLPNFGVSQIVIIQGRTFQSPYLETFFKIGVLKSVQ